MNPEKPSWVFGYGSLIWKQDFPYRDSRPGRIHGWVRRFWQGSHDHRGLAHDPGRVVTLVEAGNEICEGRAFLVDPEVFAHLDHREKNGYERLSVDIVFADEKVRGVTYRAPVGNVAYLGPASPGETAAQIMRCAGPSGTNREYVLELARALRRQGIRDDHVFEIEALVK